MKSGTPDIKSVPIKNPDAKNVIIGQSHFIKTVEDIHEVMVGSVPGIRFGLAFAEASGPRLVRTSGTDPSLTDLAARNAKAIACGHVFVLMLDNAFPINVLNAVKMVPEVVHIFCATANPVQAIVARTRQGGALLGVVDGGSPLGVETAGDVPDRKALLRKFGYKL
ncbi:adenosine-specific kinase [Patescibacteria group bacterium]|nr:adenosine-specific kinase [Patescibacteria group bacterium]